MNKQKFGMVIGATVVASGLGYLGDINRNNYYNPKPEQKNTDIQQKIEDTVSNGCGFRKTMPREYLMNPQKSSPSKSIEELRLYLAEKEMEIEKKETGKVSDLLKKEYNLQLQRVANEEIANKYFNKYIDNLLLNNGFKADELLDKENRILYIINSEPKTNDELIFKNKKDKEYEYTRFLEFNRVDKNKKSDLEFFKDKNKKSDLQIFQDECKVIIKDTMKTMYSNDAQNAYSKKDKN